MECLEDSGPGGQILRNVLRIAAPGGTSFRGAMRLGGSAKEKPLRVWGASGVGAELRFCRRFGGFWPWRSDSEEYLKDCRSWGNQISRRCVAE